MKTSILIYMAAPLLLAAGSQGASPLREVAANYGKLPLSFVPNRGQTDARVQFLAHGAGYSIFLSSGSATFAFQTGVVRMNLAGADRMAAMEPDAKLPGIANYLMGAKRSTQLPTYAKIRSHNVYPGVDLIYYGTQGQLEYDFVLAPGADLSRIRIAFEGAQPRVDASGDLVLPLGERSIRFHKPVFYQQSDGVRRAVSGGFIISRRGHVAGFRVDAYDHRRELVVDPVLLYSSYLGGSNVSEINAMAVDAAGDIYVTGATEATNYPTTAGVIETTCPLGNTQLGAPAGVPKCGEGESGTPAVFVSKISADGGTLVYSTYLGGGGNGAASDYGTGIAVDSGGNAWIVGQTGSNDFPITSDAYLSFCNPVQSSKEISGCVGNGSRSIFLVQLNPTGTAMLYGTFLGGSGDDLTAQIVLDPLGKIYVAGSAYTGEVGTPAAVLAANSQYNFPTTASAYQPIVLGGNSYSAFVTQLSADGRTLLYSTMFSGPNQNTYNSALAVNAGKIFIGGSTHDPHLPTTSGAISKTCPGGPTGAGPNTICVNNAANAYVAEFDPTKSGAASLVFSTYINGSVSTQGTESSAVNALAADAAGNVYVGGQDSYSVVEGFPTTAGVLQPACFVAHNSGQCGTGFVTKLSSTGAMVWSTFYGSPTTTGGNGVATIALDSANNVYIAANAQNLGDYPLNNGFQSFSGAGAYVTELSADGSQVLFGSFYGGNANTYPMGMAVDASGDIYLAGYTNDYLPLVNAYQSNNFGGGFPEGFFAKIGTPVPALTLVANAEGGSLIIAPNTWVEIKGTNLAPDTRTWTSSDFVNNQMPTQLDGVTVTMNGENAYIYYISPTQVNVLTPPDLAVGPVQVKVTTGGVTSAAFTAQAQAASPSFFIFGAGPYVAATHLNGSYLGPTSLIPGETTPAAPGELVVLYANGFGPTSSPVVAGSPAQSGSLAALPVVQIGGIAATVQFAGIVSPGEYQFNVYIPASAPNGDNTLTATYNGLTTQAGVMITVQH